MDYSNNSIKKNLELLMEKTREYKGMKNPPIQKKREIMKIADTLRAQEQALPKDTSGGGNYKRFE